VTGVSYFGKDDLRLESIRQRAQDAFGADDWAGFRAMEPELRHDEAFWPDVWCPISAYAAWKRGEPHPVRFLEEAIAAGFDGPGAFEAELTEAFGDDAEWPELVERMQANVPAAPLEILAWPAARPSRPTRLFRLREDREALLRERIPAAEDTAWGTALRLLTWVADAWEHANAHVDEQDALEILRLVDDGARFACVEYSTVLSHALNALDIPSRVVKLRAEGYHVGLSKGHVVSEAWIDGLDAWVLLDGQNGMYWIDDEDTPMGAPLLQDWFREGRERARHVAVGPSPVTDSDAWWRYFAHISTTGASWSNDSFVPIFQTEGVLSTEVLLRDRFQAYPDFSELTIGTTTVNGRPAIQPQSEHPYASGFRITRSDARPVSIGLDGAWALLPGPAGVHEIHIATVSKYGALTPSTVVYRVT
jgi:hypothetical protein